MRRRDAAAANHRRLLRFARQPAGPGGFTGALFFRRQRAITQAKGDETERDGSHFYKERSDLIHVLTSR